jgi:hypothetical protein
VNSLSHQDSNNIDRASLYKARNLSRKSPTLGDIIAHLKSDSLITSNMAALATRIMNNVTFSEVGHLGSSAASVVHADLTVELAGHLLEG